MTRLTIKALAFPSFVKLCAVIWFSLGIGFGVVAFIGSVFGIDVRMNFMEADLTGIPAGIAAIPVAPILFTVLGALLAVVGFLPFKWLLRTIGGIDLTGDWGPLPGAPEDGSFR